MKTGDGGLALIKKPALQMSMLNRIRYSVLLDIADFNVLS